MTAKSALFVLMLPVAAVVIAASAIVSGQAGATNGEWPHWGADLGSSKYSPLDQINRDNVKNLRVAWRWKSENFGPRPQNNMEATPLMVGGVLYTTAGFRPNVAAIDAATGETLWTYRFDEGQRGDRAPRSVSRGVEYWTDGKQARIILVTRGYQLVSLDAKTGLPDPAFGRNGVVDLYQDFDQPPPGDGVISSTSPAVVVRNVIVFGAAMVGGTAPRSKENTKGYIRGFDVRSGKRLWTFHTIPQPGEFGNDTWQNDSWSYTGNTTVWSPFSATKSSATSICPSNRRPAISTAATVRGTICSPAASCAWTRERANACGTSSSCTTTSGTTIWRRRRTSSTSPSTGNRFAPWRR